MGTRSLIHIKDGRTTLATIYRQYDGYPTGMGEDIKKLLNNGQVDILNGINGLSKTPAQFNGIGCLAAFLVGELKNKQIGNVYIMPPGRNGFGEEYIYTITSKDGEVYMKVQDVWNKKILFNGLLSKFDGNIAEGMSIVESALT
jgi:hypothetical protein